MPRKTFTYEGKRYDVTAADPEELAVKIAMRKRDVDEGKKKISKNMLVKDWFKEFMNTYKEKSISVETYDDWTSRANSMILPKIGHKRLKDVKPLDCQNIINDMEGYSRTYIRKVANTMDQMFDKAVKNNLLIENPALTNDLEIPEDAEDGTHRAITEAERKYTYLVAETHRGGLWVLTMLLTGMRPSETATLQWRHFDFKKMAITIESSVKKKDRRIGKTKTKSGNRIVPMPDELVDKYKSLDLEPFDYIFKNEVGGRLSKSNMRIMWNNFKREMNIAMGCKVVRNQVLPLNFEDVKENKVKPIYLIADDLVPYCYRHTFCTDLEAAGVSINEAARLMGHKNIAITSRIYTHPSEASFDRVSNQINAYRKAQKNKTDVGNAVGVISIRVEK